uniref:methyl-accepting chemotaxis protein n=1 Tax=Microvirga roseola TaxID=2883126 RepID=UPI001E4712D6
MRFLNNLRLGTKLAIPVAIFIAVTVGLIVLAEIGLGRMAKDTQELVDVDAARLTAILSISADLNQATIQEKNIIADKNVEARKGYADNYARIKQVALKKLEALPGQENLKTLILKYVELMDRSVAHGVKGYEDEAAMTVSNGEGRSTRQQLDAAVAEMVDASMLALERAKNEANDLTNRMAWLLVVSAAIGVLAALGLIAAIVVYGITRPLSGITSAMGRLASGDLAVNVTGAERRDEVGQLARALQVFKDNAIEARRLAAEQEAENEAKMRRAQMLDQLTREFEANVSALTHGLSSAATEMESTAQSMRSVADQTTGQSVQVASAAEQTSANVQTVAAATEELSISIREIASQVGQSSQIAERAVADAQRTNVTVQALADTAEKIGNVIALINTIAGQTNLLALNATIE